MVAAANAGNSEAMLWLGIRYSNYNQDVPSRQEQDTYKIA
jgi:hypothetical protein